MSSVSFGKLVWCKRTLRFSALGFVVLHDTACGLQEWDLRTRVMSLPSLGDTVWQKWRDFANVIMKLYHFILS